MTCASPDVAEERNGAGRDGVGGPVDQNVTPQIKAPLGNCLSQTVTYGALIWSETLFEAARKASCESDKPKLAKILENMTW